MHVRFLPPSPTECCTRDVTLSETSPGEAPVNGIGWALRHRGRLRSHEGGAIGGRTLECGSREGHRGPLKETEHEGADQNRNS